MITHFGPREANHPDELKWIEGDLPDVHEVVSGCSILAWIVWNHPTPEKGGIINGQKKRIVVVMPRKFDNLSNPLCWCDTSMRPIGYDEKVKFWAWVRQI